MPAPIRLALAAALVAAIAPQPARACSVCACGDPLLAASEAPAMAGALRLTVDAEWLRVRAASDAGPGLTDRLTQQTLRLGAVWSPADRLNLALAVPLTQKTMATVGAGPAAPVSDELGLGDVDVGVRWFPFTSADLGARRAQALGLSLGTSLPTGPRKATLDEHGQLGTGAFGPYAGLLYRYGQGDLAAVASLTGRVRTLNADGYRYGGALLWTVQGEWDVHPRVSVALGLDGREAWADRAAGADVADTGGLVLAAAPAVSVNVAPGLFASLRGQLPVFTRLRGAQSVDPTMTLGLQWQAF
ncbi:MAG TPA: hypothetical protein VFP50_14385 [Anaeromyxobacteraceae bacterium]|nr:hypothetical protein [Anaeromyxobacteraceae bacterium]